MDERERRQRRHRQQEEHCMYSKRVPAPRHWRDVHYEHELQCLMVGFLVDFFLYSIYFNG